MIILLMEASVSPVLVRSPDRDRETVQMFSFLPSIHPSFLPSFTLPAGVKQHMGDSTWSCEAALSLHERD